MNLPLIPSIRFDWAIDPATPLERFWVEKGADTPSADGTHRDALGDGDRWEGTSSTYARPAKNRPREMIPYVLIEGTRNGPASAGISASSSADACASRSRAPARAAR